MSNIARRLTGLTESQLREYDFPRVDSKEQVFKPRNVCLRSNVRLESGMIVGISDLDSDRKRLSESEPKSLQP
jgi:hypothetical protein